MWGKKVKRKKYHNSYFSICKCISRFTKKWWQLQKKWWYWIDVIIRCGFLSTKKVFNIVKNILCFICLQKHIGGSVLQLFKSGRWIYQPALSILTKIYVWKFDIGKKNYVILFRSEVKVLLICLRMLKIWSKIWYFWRYGRKDSSCILKRNLICKLYDNFSDWNVRSFLISFPYSSLFNFLFYYVAFYSFENSKAFYSLLPSYNILNNK